jgi:hypothetical protein
MIYYKVSTFDTARREFIAKITADLGKTIFAVGLASYFFEKFPSSLQIVLWSICVIFLMASIFIYPNKKKGT